MKIPIWAKDNEGKYRLFPYHLLHQFADGEVGLADCWEQLWEPKSTFAPFKHLFEFEWKQNEAARYILRSSLKGAE